MSRLGVGIQRLVHLDCVQVEVAEGFVLTSFSDPGAALRWALATQSRMLRLPWSPKLLEHELGEEVHVMQTNSSLGPSRQPVVLFRGPRIKVRAQGPQQRGTARRAGPC